MEKPGPPPAGKKDAKAGREAPFSSRGPAGREPPYIKAILEMLEMDGRLLGSKLAEWNKAGFDTSSVRRALEKSPDEWVPAFMLFNTGVIAIQTLVERYKDPSDRDLDERAIEILDWMTDTRDINRSLDGIMSALQAPGATSVPPTVKKLFTDTGAEGLRAVLPENLFGRTDARIPKPSPAGPDRPIATQVFDDALTRTDLTAGPSQPRGPFTPPLVAEAVPLPPEATPVPAPLEALPAPPTRPPLTAEPAWNAGSAGIAEEVSDELDRLLKGAAPGEEPHAAAGGPGDRRSRPIPLDADRYELMGPEGPAGGPGCLVDTFERDVRSLFLAMRLVEILLSKVDRAKLYEVLERYERFGWISEDVRVSLMTMARGMRSSAPPSKAPRISARVDRTTSVEQEIVQRLFFQMFAGSGTSRPMGLFLNEHSTVMWFLAKMAGVNISEQGSRALAPYVEALRRAYSL